MPEHRIFCDKQAKNLQCVLQVMSNKMSYNQQVDLMQWLGKWTVTFSKCNVYKFWDLCSSVPEGSTLLGYGVASMDNQILTFWGQSKSSSSRFKMCSWAYQPLKIRTLCCPHMFRSSYPLIHHNMPEEQKLKFTAASYCVQLERNLHVMVLKTNLILSWVQQIHMQQYNIVFSRHWYSI